MDLGNHPARDLPRFDQFVGEFRGQPPHGPSIRPVDAGHVGDEDDVVAGHGPGNVQRRVVRVDVVGFPVGAPGNGRDDRRDPVRRAEIEQGRVHLDDLADEADVHAVLPVFLRPQQAHVLPAHAQGVHAAMLEARDQFLVDLARQDHFHHFHHVAVRDPEAVHEGELLAQQFQVPADLRPAAVDDDREHVRHVPQVGGQLFDHAVLLDGRAAQFYHDGSFHDVSVASRSIPSSRPGRT